MRPFSFVMSVINPDFFRDQYNQTMENAHDAGRRPSDIQRQLIADTTLMNAQWDLDNAWYNAHQSSGAKFNELRDLGINPLSAARSVLGNPQSAVQTSSPTVSATGADSDLTSTVDALATSLGSVNQAVQTDLSREQTNANVRNLESETANNIARNPYISGLAKSEILKNEASAMESEAHSSNLNVQQQEIISRANLNDKEAAQIVKVMSRYDELTSSQISMLENQSNLYFEEAITQGNIRKNIDSDTVLKLSQTYGEYAEADLNLAQSKFYDEQTGQLKTINQFVSETGIPLASDDLATLNYYESKGDYISAQRYLNTIFDCAAAREGGHQSISLPADNARTEYTERAKYDFSVPTSFREGIFKGFFYKYPNRHYNPNLSNPSSYSFGPKVHR